MSQHKSMTPYNQMTLEQVVSEMNLPYRQAESNTIHRATTEHRRSKDAARVVK